MSLKKDFINLIVDETSIKNETVIYDLNLIIAP